MMQVILAIVAQLLHSSVPKAGPAGCVFVPQCFKEKETDEFLTMASCGCHHGHVMSDTPAHW